MREFKIAAVFSSNMVLQREKNVQLFGEGEDGQIVTLEFMNQTYSTKINEGKWMVTLPPMLAGAGYDMVISCNEVKKTFKNIAIGEVWLAGGQSNMELELRNAKGGADMLKNDKNPNVRYYYTNKNAIIDDDFYKMEEESAWSEFSEENAKAWSAVGYIYGKKIAKELGVTVGIIGCNWGGTSASCWMSEGKLEQDKELNTYVDEYKEKIEGISIEQQALEYIEYEEYHGIWEKQSAKLYEENPEIEWEDILKICGECKWPGPMSSVNPFRPAGLYKTMVQRIIPYTLRGFIYYQGESDDHKPKMYQKLLTNLIYQWREDWQDITLPFLMVQLPMHRSKADPDYKHWCLIREAQMRTYETVKNTGIAVILDCGEFNEIHPKDKQPVGERLGLQALYHVYETIQKEEAFGPMYKSFIIKENKMELSFYNAEKGFTIKGSIAGFEIAGDDKDYKKAEAKIEKDKIVLCTQEVLEPKYARYAWTNYGEVTIFGKNGIPLAPFRTSIKDSKD